MNILDLAKKKKSGEKISMVTCYDYTSACILAKTTIDCLLVGDSLAMTMHGFESTLSATLEMMCLHTAAVKRGAGDKLVIGDMPFLSYRKSFNDNVTAVQRLMQSGADSIKLENADGNLELIEHLVKSGIPIVGHLGLTPQSVMAFGGYKIQGKTDEAADKIKRDARLLQNAGCSCIVLECVPQSLAKEITDELLIPTIGIGAGKHTSGQVLVYQDLLGFNPDFKAKFVKHYLNGAELITLAMNTFVDEIGAGDFPDNEHSY